MDKTAFDDVFSFNDRVAAVTGATGNIGSATCRLLARLGVAVAVTDLDRERCDALAAELRAAGGRAGGYKMDVTDAEDVRAAFAAILADFGKVDILVNNAGLWNHADSPGRNRFEEMPEREWRRILETNVSGTFRCTQAVLPGMVERGFGRIVNLGSIAGEVGLPGLADYSAAKAAAILLTKTLAMENGKRGVTVNCVSPGMITTNPYGTAGTWLGRAGTPEEVARVIAFLASDTAGYLTGVDLPVDGGRGLGPHNCDM